MTKAPAMTQFGITITNQHPLGADLSSRLKGELALVDAAVASGWDSISVTQHFLTGGALHGIDQIAMLGRLIDRTGELTLAVGINLLPLHNPVAIAEQFASIDVMSGGRLLLGVGLGYREEEYAAFGVPRGQRVARLEGNLAALIELWTSSAPRVDLPWCQVDGTPISVRPLQQPRPPILMAANADAAVRRAALLSDGWAINPHGDVATIARQVDLFRSTREAAGITGPGRLALGREIFCAPTRAEAFELARPFLGEKYDTYADWGQDKALPGEESFRIPFEELAADRFIIGSPADCVEMLVAWASRLGITDFGLRTNWFGMPHDLAIECARLLAAEVFPEVRRRLEDRP